MGIVGFTRPTVTLPSLPRAQEPQALVELESAQASHRLRTGQDRIAAKSRGWCSCRVEVHHVIGPRFVVVGTKALIAKEGATVEAGEVEPFFLMG